MFYLSKYFFFKFLLACSAANQGIYQFSSDLRFSSMAGLFMNWYVFGSLEA